MTGDMEIEAYNEAVKRIKDNTCQLAKRQVTKILRPSDVGESKQNRRHGSAVYSGFLGYFCDVIICSGDDGRLKVNECVVTYNIVLGKVCVVGEV